LALCGAHSCLAGGAKEVLPISVLKEGKFGGWGGGGGRGERGGCYSCVVYVFILDGLEEVIEAFCILAEDGRSWMPMF